MTASAPVLGGQFAAEYEARLRFFATLPQVEKTSHFAGLRFEGPLGSRGTFRVSHRFTRAVLETTVVDPGQEYFFDLAPFTFNETMVGAHIDLGARLFTEGGLGWSWSRFDPGATGFFGYDSRTARAGLGYDLGGDLRLVLSYVFERIPPAPDRAIAESDAHNVVGTLTGPIGPLMTGSLSAGFRSQTNPLATGTSASYHGLTLGGTLSRQLGHSSSLDLTPAPRHRSLLLRGERLLRDEPGRPRAAGARTLRDLGARLGELAEERLPERRAGDRRAAERPDPRLDGRRRPRDQLACLAPRRLHPPESRLERAGLRREHERLHPAGRGGTEHGRTAPMMTAAALVFALLQAVPAPAAPPSGAPALGDPAAAQAAPAQVPAAPAPAAASGPNVPNAADYQVGPGDLLEVSVIGNDDLSRVPTVQTNGAVTMPLLGEVQVAGLTVAEIQRKVTSLLEKDYLVSPQVEVKVREFHSQYVSVVGEVNTPGRKPLRGRTRLFDALIEAGGFKATASGEIVITRTDGTFDGGGRALKVRISGAATPQDTVNLELPLRSGDIITASPKYFVTVDGEVMKPSRYAIESDLTVTGAISLAGGLTRFGSGTVKLRRTDAQTGQVSVIEVSLKDVRNGKKPDVPLLPNDVISVPRRVF